MQGPVRLEHIAVLNLQVWSLASVQLTKSLNIKF